MKTRERILKHSLALFNEKGEPCVTTMDIAQELNISPGNLYYHFKGKENILNVLFEHLSQHLKPRLEELEDSLVGVENQPLVLQALYETLWDYRFIFHDSYRLALRYPRLKRRLQNLLVRLRMAFTRWVELLEELKLLSLGNKEDKLLLIENLNVYAVSWLSYNTILFKESPDSQKRRAVAQTMALITHQFTKSTPKEDRTLPTQTLRYELSD